MSTTFAQPVNNFATTLASGHTAGSGTLALAVSPGTLAAGRIWRVTALSNPGTETETVLGIFEATGNSGATLTGVTGAEGFSDAPLPSGTAVEIRITAKGLSEIQTAVNTLESGGAGGGITALTGDVTATGPGSAAATLKTVNSNVGTFTLATIAVNAKGLITAASNGTASGTGTVTSVALAMPSIMTVTGSPVTTTGTLTGTLATQTANRGWFGPTSGAAAAPTFRAMVAADLPLPALGIYDVIVYGADPTGAADSTAAIQAAVNACQAASGGVIWFPPGTYKTTATIAIGASNVIVRGATTKSSKILCTSATAYIFTIIAPGGTGAPLLGVGVADICLDFTVTQPATGGGVFAQYTAGAVFERITIGQPTTDLTTGYFPHNGIVIDGLFNAYVLDNYIYCNGKGLALSRIDVIIRGNTIYSYYAPGSIGIHCGGGVVMSSLLQTDVGRWETSMLIDMTLFAGANREHFIGPGVFLDDPVIEGLRIKPSSLPILQWTDVWCAGVAQHSASPVGDGYPYGSAINIDSPNSGLKVTLTGGRIYQGKGGGIVASAGRLTVTGLQIHTVGTGANGGHALDILGGAAMDGVTITGCSIKNNGVSARGTGINVAASTNGFTIVGNDIESNAQGQIAIGSGCDNYIVTGNTLVGTSLITNTPGTAATRHVSNNAGIADSSGASLASGEVAMAAPFAITATSGTYQDTGLSVSLPGAGTYQISANVRTGFQLTATVGTNGWITIQLYQSDTASFVPNSIRFCFYDGIQLGYLWQSQSAFTFRVSVSSACTVSLYAARNGTGTYTLSSILTDSGGVTTMGYVQIA